jgi:hypothetical protein
MRGRVLSVEQCIKTLSRKGIYFEGKVGILGGAKDIGIKSLWMIDFLKKQHFVFITNKGVKV